MMCFRSVVFGMNDARTGAHELNAARLDDAMMPLRILMLEPSAENVRQNFHVPMRVIVKPLSRFDEVFVEKDERTPDRSVCASFIIDPKRPPAFKPAEIVVKPVVALLNLERWGAHVHFN